MEDLKAKNLDLSCAEYTGYHLFLDKDYQDKLLQEIDLDFAQKERDRQFHLECKNNIVQNVSPEIEEIKNYDDYGSEDPVFAHDYVSANLKWQG